MVNLLYFFNLLDLPEDGTDVSAWWIFLANAENVTAPP